MQNKHIFYVFSGGVNVNGLSKGCVEIGIVCETVSAFIDFIEDCITGQIKDLFKPLEKELKNITKYPHLEIDVIMQEEDILTAIKDIRKIKHIVTLHIKLHIKLCGHRFSLNYNNKLQQ